MWQDFPPKKQWSSLWSKTNLKLIGPIVAHKTLSIYTILLFYWFQLNIYSIQDYPHKIPNSISISPFIYFPIICFILIKFLRKIINHLSTQNNSISIQIPKIELFDVNRWKSITVIENILLWIWYFHFVVLIYIHAIDRRPKIDWIFMINMVLGHISIGNLCIKSKCNAINKFNPSFYL